MYIKSISKNGDLMQERTFKLLCLSCNWDADKVRRKIGEMGYTYNGYSVFSLESMVNLAAAKWKAGIRSEKAGIAP